MKEMKKELKKELKFQNSGDKNAFDLFEYLLKKLNYNLNQYILDDCLSISNEVHDEVGKELEEFLDLVLVEFRNSDKKESFFERYDEIAQYNDNDKFIEWIKKYVTSLSKPYYAATFLREMPLSDFTDLSEYCFNNFIIKDSGRENIGNGKWDNRNVITMQKIMFTFAEMIFEENCSYDYAISNMENIFALEKEYVNIWVKMMSDNEEKLWKIMLMRKYCKLEEKIDKVLDYFEQSS